MVPLGRPLWERDANSPVLWEIDEDGCVESGRWTACSIMSGQVHKKTVSGKPGSLVASSQQPAPVTHFQPVLNQWVARQPNSRRIWNLSRPKDKLRKLDPPFHSPRGRSMDEARLKFLAQPKERLNHLVQSLPSSGEKRCIDKARLCTLAMPPCRRNVKSA